MISPRRLYARFDEWSRTLSRASYAALVGVASGLTFLGVSAVFGDAMFAGAVAFGATMVGLQYVFHPNQTRDARTEVLGAPPYAESDCSTSPVSVPNTARGSGT